MAQYIAARQDYSRVQNASKQRANIHALLHYNSSYFYMCKLPQQFIYKARAKVALQNPIKVKCFDT